MKIASGYNRFVLLVGNLAIKFPNPRSQRQFIHGMTCNLKEFEMHQEAKGDPRLMTIYSIGWIGLWLVCKRYDLLQRRLTEDELEQIPVTQIDGKIGNFGSDNGRIVILDYGYSGSWYTR